VNAHAQHPPTNAELAARLEEAAELSALAGENPFKARAYAQLARTVRALAPQVAALVAADEDLVRIPGAGKHMREHLVDLVRTGTFPRLEELRARVHPGLRELLGVEGLGPKRVQLLHESLGVSNVEDLSRALDDGRLRALPGFGERSAARLRAALLARARSGGRRWPWSEAEPIATEMVRHLAGVPGVARVEVAGSFRRRKATVGDLDVLVCAGAHSPVAARFVEHPWVEEVLARGRTRSSVRLRSGLQVDLRVVPEESFGAALVYLTGSKAHNIALRRRGQELGLKVNEYGVWRAKQRVAGRTEEDVYAALGLPFVPPERREE
jgi:DNA polymerase (family 10)